MTKNEIFQKIQKLIESGNRQNLELAFQLGEAQGFSREEILAPWVEFAEICYNELGVVDEYFSNEDLYGIIDRTTFNYSKGGLGKIPEQLFCIHTLDELVMDHNQIKTLPKNMGKMSNLKWLYLSQNLLSELPKSFEMLQNLIYLTLNDNQFTTFPEVLCHLTNLQVLHFQNNPISNFEANFSSLVHLKELNLIGTPISTAMQAQIRKQLPACKLVFE
jgi:hypothetical protein